MIFLVVLLLLLATIFAAGTVFGYWLGRYRLSQNRRGFPVAPPPPPAAPPDRP